MVRGVATIQTTLTQSHESGVYRVTNTGQRFLMLPFDNPKEAISCGSALAKMLSVPFKNTLPAEQLPSLICHDKAPVKRDVDPERSDLGIISDFILGEDSECPSVVPIDKPRPKVKKVMGVGKQVSEFVKNGKKDEEIIETLLPLYLDAGRQEAESRGLILWYISDARKGGKNKENDRSLEG